MTSVPREHSQNGGQVNPALIADWKKKKNTEQQQQQTAEKPAENLGRNHRSGLVWLIL